MCGIAGYLRFDDQPAQSDRAERMIATLRHRGPDDTGVFVDGPVALAAARLSIIDVAGGHQPLSIDDRGITVAQNGEIYNYVELQRELAAQGARLRTSCDTEVIGHLYAREQERAFTRLRGMFAIAIWDRRESAADARTRPGGQETALCDARQSASCCSHRRRRRFSPSSSARPRYSGRRCSVS